MLDEHPIWHPRCERHPRPFGKARIDRSRFLLGFPAGQWRQERPTIPLDRGLSSGPTRLALGLPAPRTALTPAMRRATGGTMIPIVSDADPTPISVASLVSVPALVDAETVFEYVPATALAVATKMSVRLLAAGTDTAGANVHCTVPVPPANGDVVGAPIVPAPDVL